MRLAFVRSILAIPQIFFDLILGKLGFDYA